MTVFNVFFSQNPRNLYNLFNFRKPKLKGMEGYGREVKLFLKFVTFSFSRLKTMLYICKKLDTVIDRINRITKWITNKKCSP
jgi:hypothetical protein